MDDIFILKFLNLYFSLAQIIRGPPFKALTVSKVLNGGSHNVKKIFQKRRVSY